MTDIVERLRKQELVPSWEVTQSLFGEAADEIERLRAALRGAATVVRASADEIDRLRKEIEHLREIIHAGVDEIERLRKLEPEEAKP